jgi:hypothetical protein
MPQQYSVDIRETIMGSPLAEVENLANSSSPDPPFLLLTGANRDKPRAKAYFSYLNSLTDDLVFSEEHPSPTASSPSSTSSSILTFDKSTSVC